jgi:TorA maturation chaperone TorD
VADRLLSLEAQRARGALYRLLARVFAREVDLELILHLRGPVVRTLLRKMDPGVEEDLPAADEGAALLRLAGEYRRLFLGAEPPAAPLEASWSAHRPAQVSGRDVLQHYREAGLAPEEDPHFVPDHVAMILEFLAVLSERETLLLEEGNPEEAHEVEERARTFFQDHVGWWVERFGRQVARSSASPLYRSAGMLLAQLVAKDAESMARPDQ